MLVGLAVFCSILDSNTIVALFVVTVSLKPVGEKGEMRFMGFEHLTLMHITCCRTKADDIEQLVY